MDSSSLWNEHEQIISEWLSFAEEPEKLAVQQTQIKIVVTCGDSLQAGRLSRRVGRLVKTRLNFVEIYVGKGLFNNIALERIAKNDRHRFIYSLLQTHQEILEVGSMKIDANKVRIYCASKEEAIALYEGQWDLAERAQEMQLPEQFELYYFSADQKPCLLEEFSVQEGLLVKRLQLREIAALLQKLDVNDNT